MKKLLIAGAALAALSLGGAASAATFPGIGQNPNGPSLLITLGAGSATIAANPACSPSCGPYDGSEDTYIGVINNSGGAVSSINISSTQDIFGFDSDGIAGFANSGGGNAQDPSGYGGPNVFFTNIVRAALSTGTVNFIGGLANGGSSYFSLEEPLSAADFQGITTGGIPEPATWAMMLVGFFGLGSVLRRQRDAALA